MELVYAEFQWFKRLYQFPEKIKHDKFISSWNLWKPPLPKTVYWKIHDKQKQQQFYVCYKTDQATIIQWWGERVTPIHISEDYFRFIKFTMQEYDAWLSAHSKLDKSMRRNHEL